MILKNCRLIPELSGGISAEHATVIISGGEICQILDDNESLAFQEREAIDCEGKTLLPGLIDLHTHITIDSAAEWIEPAELAVRGASMAKKYLNHGFTTIRDAGSAYRVNNIVRDAIEDGLIDGPRIISSGYILEPPETSASDPQHLLYRFASGPDEFMKLSRIELTEGADYVKIMASGSALQKTGIPRQPIMTEEEIRACVCAAEMKETYVAAHAHSSGAINNCIRAGVRTIEHASFIDDEGIALLKNAPNCYLVPTMAAFYQDEKDTQGTYFEYLIEKLKNMLELCHACIGKAYTEGITKMGFGTDCGPGMYQYENGTEFRYRYEFCGMRPLDILLQATKYNAEIAGINETTGEIRESLAADLILVDGNPDKDISVMYKKPEHVWLGGRQVK